MLHRDTRTDVLPKSVARLAPSQPTMALSASGGARRDALRAAPGYDAQVQMLTPAAKANGPAKPGGISILAGANTHELATGNRLGGVTTGGLLDRMGEGESLSAAMAGMMDDATWTTVDKEIVQGQPNLQ